MSLESVRSLLSRLDNPHLGRRTIHVTGSKGKGSTSTMLASVLSQSNLHTALFTSPHLHAYTEQMTFDLQNLSEAEFATGIAAIRAAVEAEDKSGPGPVSAFGLLCALFFHLCKQQDRPVDWQIVEVGLGGAHDATNVFASKDLAIITPISLEHTAILGKSTSEIAAAKAGIIVSGCTTVLASQEDRAVKPVIAKRCYEVGSRLIDVGELYAVRQVTANEHCQTFVLTGPNGTHEVRLQMLGKHQVQNATTAIAAAEALIELGIPITDTAIVTGLRQAKIPARFEILRRNPAIVVDGAHNGHSAAALRQALIDHLGIESCIFVLGVNSDKDIDAICHCLAPITKGIVATRSGNLRAMNVEHIASVCRALNLPVTTTESVRQALIAACTLSEGTNPICITGSFYVAAEARRIIQGSLLPSPG